MNPEIMMQLGAINYKIKRGILLEDEENAMILQHFSELYDRNVALEMESALIGDVLFQFLVGGNVVFRKSDKTWWKLEFTQGMKLKAYRANPPKAED